MWNLGGTEAARTNDKEETCLSLNKDKTWLLQYNNGTQTSTDDSDEGQ